MLLLFSPGNDSFALIEKEGQSLKKHLCNGLFETTICLCTVCEMNEMIKIGYSKITLQLQCVLKVQKKRIVLWFVILR